MTEFADKMANLMREKARIDVHSNSISAEPDNLFELYSKLGTNKESVAIALERGNSSFSAEPQAKITRLPNGKVDCIEFNAGTFDFADNPRSIKMCGLRADTGNERTSSGNKQVDKGKNEGWFQRWEQVDQVLEDTPYTDILRYTWSSLDKDSCNVSKHVSGKTAGFEELLDSASLLSNGFAETIFGAVGESLRLPALIDPKSNKTFENELRESSFMRALNNGGKKMIIGAIEPFHALYNLAGYPECGKINSR